MTAFTKKSNYIFRGTIAAALGAAVMQIVSGGMALQQIAGHAAGATNSLSGVLVQGQPVTIALLAAALFSVMAFHSGSEASGIIRTIALVGMAALSTVSTNFFAVSDMILRMGSKAADIESVKPFLNTLAENGVTQTEAAEVLARIGIVISACIAAALMILVITSVVSIVKNAKTEKAVNAKTCAA